MPNYVLIHGQFHELPDDELMHYGVKGMKWGVRRGLKELHESNSTGSKGAHNHAVAVLSGHRDKINKKIANLDKKLVNLDKKSGAKTQTKIEKNNRLKEIYKKSLNEINHELITKGQDFLYMKPNGMPYTNADID